MSEWKEVKLGDYIDMTNGYAFKSKSFVNRGIPVLKIKNIKTNKIIIEDIDYISADDNNPRYTIIKPNDLIITMTGNRIDGSPETWVGKVALFNLDGKYFLNQRLSIIRVKKDLVNLLFILYSLTTIDAQKYFITHATSSGGQANISPDIVKNFTIKLPSYIIQSEIAGILSSLDAKIETNNKLNEKLEEMAQAIFKSWFVDFEPFKDQPFHETELGMIPEGWEVTTIGENLKTALGGTPSRNRDDYWNGEIAWINSGEINKFRIIQASEYITENGLKSSATKLLPAKTTVLAITGATLGQVSLLEIDTCANQSVIGVLESDAIKHQFIYPLIKSQIKYLILHQTGGAQQHINKQNVDSIQFVLPPKDILDEYQIITKKIFDQISTLCFENQRLASLRDTLLPRLMSGEIKI